MRNSSKISKTRYNKPMVLLIIYKEVLTRLLAYLKLKDGMKPIGIFSKMSSRTTQIL
jgi:hypothetical protein